MPLVEIKDFTALIENNPFFFFDHPVKSKPEEDEKLIEMSRNYDYTTRNLLVYLYHQNIINSLVQIYHDKKIRAAVKKLVL